MKIIDNDGIYVTDFNEGDRIIKKETSEFLDQNVLFSPENCFIKVLYIF
jgi:hypothetical protein